MAACSSMPDGIDEDAMAPYCIAPRTLLCNSTRTLGTTAFSPTNNCLYYEMDNVEDRNASGVYKRTSEEEATVMIFGNDYTVEYKLKFETPSKGKLEETYTVNDFAQKHTGNFMLR